MNMTKEQNIEYLKQLIDELRQDGCNKLADLMCDDLKDLGYGAEQ